MDLSLLAADTCEGSVMQVYNPKTNKPVEGMTVNVLSIQHETVQAVFRKHRQRASLRVGRDGKPLALTDAETEKNAIETYQALIESWEGFTLDGKELRCTPDNIAMIVKDEKKRWDWLLGDILGFASDLTNFFRADDASGDVAETTRVASQRARKGISNEG